MYNISLVNISLNNVQNEIIEPCVKGLSGTGILIILLFNILFFMLLYFIFKLKYADFKKEFGMFHKHSKTYFLLYIMALIGVLVNGALLYYWFIL